MATPVLREAVSTKSVTPATRDAAIHDRERPGSNAAIDQSYLAADATATSKSLPCSEYRTAFAVAAHGSARVATNVLSESKVERFDQIE